METENAGSQKGTWDATPERCLNERIGVLEGLVTNRRKRGYERLREVHSQTLECYVSQAVWT